MTPKVGITYVCTIRDRATETRSIFGLTVARDRHDAIFGDAAFWPYVSFGLRAQYKGRLPTAIGGYAGAPLALVATGEDDGHRVSRPVLSSE